MIPTMATNRDWKQVPDPIKTIRGNECDLSAVMRSVDTVRNSVTIAQK